MSNKVSLGHMTWREVEEVATRNPVILVPMGTLESQGLHSPMGYDYLLAERLAEEVAKRTDSLVVPTLPFGYSHFSRPFPGTISLRPKTLRYVITDLLESLIRSGFDHILFLNNHGLNEPILGHVADQIREEYGLTIFSMQPSKLARDLGQDLFENPHATFAHGGEPTISLMLYLLPDAMYLDELEKREWGEFQSERLAGPGAIRFAESTISVYADFRELAPTGGMGDPTQASPEKGRLMFDRSVDYLTAFIDTFQQIKTTT